MARFILAVALVFVSSFTVSQTSVSDPQARTLALKSVAALTNGVTVSDVTLTADVTSIAGSDVQSGTATLIASTTNNSSRVDLNLSNTNISEVRNVGGEGPAGAWVKNGSKSRSTAQHNNWTDAAWFFPSLSCLSQTTNPAFTFRYIGQEQYGGVTVQHIRVFQTQTPTIQQLSMMDFYLDAGSSLPLGLKFMIHADQDMNIDIPVEVRFANYQPMNGILVPLQIQSLVNNSLALDISVTNAAFNIGEQPGTFTLP